MKITPVLIVEQIEPSLEFWVGRMGFEKTVEVPEEDRLGFVILVRNGVELMLQAEASVRKDQPEFAPEEKGSRASLFIEVDDFPDTAKRLAGYPIAMPERDTFYGMREIGVFEPGGPHRCLRRSLTFPNGDPPLNRDRCTYGWFLDQMNLLNRFLKSPLPTSASRKDQTPSLFSPDGLSRLENYTGYGTAAPYPHLVLDGIFNPEALHTVLQEWPDLNEGNGELHDDGTFVKKKFATTWKTKLGASTQSYLQQLSNPAFLIVLQKVTGLWGLLPDPYFFGGGLHATTSGGKLAVHADFNKHPVTKLDRRLNLLIYLNEGWTDENGGWLELWGHDMKECEKRILPVFNRMVLFSTTSQSFHGQPEPIVGPPGLWRKSIALYYFSNGRPEEPQATKNDEHSTLWQRRPGQGY